MAIEKYKLLAAICLVILSSFLCAKPDRKRPEPPPAPKEIKLPAIPKGQTNWGVLVMRDETTFTILGHPNWDAFGRIDPATGKIYVTWIHGPDGKSAPGIYTVNDKGDLEGTWGWAENVRIEMDGALGGNVMPDHVHNQAK